MTFALVLVLETVGEDALAAFLSGNQLLAVFASALVGLVPNCSASVVITQLYLEGVLGFAPEAGASVTLIDNQGGNLLGTFAAKGDSVLYGGRPYRLNVQYGAGDGDDVVLTVVPQGTLMILK